MGSELDEKIFLVGLLIFGLFVSGCMSSDKYTLDQFNQLYPGMTYYQCTNILKSQGTLISQSQTDIMGKPYRLEMYSFKNKNGSNMVLSFENGILNSKGQLGLK